jgi:hypothetical protein
MVEVALCLYGQMRSWNKAYYQLEKKLIRRLDPDIFIHTWRNRGGKPSADPSEKADDIQDREIGESEIIRQYEPKSIQIEEFNQEYYNKIHNVHIPESYQGAKSTLPLLYKMYACVELKKKWERKNNFEYDIVILTRPDIAFIKPLPPETLNSEGCVWQLRRNFDLVDDLVLIGTSDEIDKISMCFQNVEDYLTNEKFDGVMEILSHHAHKTNVEIRNADASRGENFEIIRYGTNIDIFHQNLLKQIIFILIHGDTGIYKNKTSLHYAARYLHERRGGN